MRGIRMLPSCFRPNSGSKPSESGKNQAEPQSSKSTSKGGLPSQIPSNQKNDSNPSRYFPNPPERPQVDPIRLPIKRAEADAKGPKHFGRFLGIPLPFSKNAGSKEKLRAMGKAGLTYQHIEPHLEKNPRLMKIILDKHPRFENYSPDGKAKALKVIEKHPEYTILLRKVENEESRIPSAATATRTMKPSEQKFLTNAFQQLSEDYHKNPFHIHGETAITGTKEGVITQFNYSPKQSSHASPGKGDKFHLHTHPPFMEPATSSASVRDHLLASRFYLRDNNKTHSYVTNGKDVLHIQPNSTELVKLIPDPKQEKKLGKFPVAYTIPDPKRPPDLYSNHEAPDSFNPWFRNK